MIMTYVPRIGDIGLTTIADWGGRGIRAAQRLMGCPWKAKQHAFVVTEAGSKFQDEMIIEAMPGGARHTEMWHDRAQTIYLRCPDEFREAVAAAALGMEDVPYSWLDYEAIALHHLHMPSGWIKDYIKSTDHEICSQLADEAALRGGWHLFDDGRWSGYVPPCDLWRLYDKQARI
jgi:hypothetical protein